MLEKFQIPVSAHAQICKIHNFTGGGGSGRPPTDNF